MKGKIKEMFESILRFGLFWGIVISVGYVAFDQDPEIYWINRLIGFFAILYFVGRWIFPERFKEKEINL